MEYGSQENKVMSLFEMLVNKINELEPDYLNNLTEAEILYINLGVSNG